MRILHINCNYIGTALHQLMIEHLDKLGYDNSVFVPTYDINTATIVPNNNVCVSECFSKWDRLIFDYKQNKIIRSVQSNYDIDKFQCIHAYTLFSDGNCARNLSKKFNIPYVVAVRNTDVNDFFRLMPHLRNRGIQIMRDASAVFFLSKSYRKQVFENYIPYKYHKEIEDKTYIIPNGIDSFWLENSFNDNKKIDESKIKLVYAGRIDKNKNILTTQKSMSILREKGYNVSLTIVGKIQDQREFDIIDKDKYTNYLPAMPKEKLIDVYRAADIFVMPSHTESFGLVYAEAMSQGLPVIYSKGQGFDGQFDEGFVGYHVSPHDANDVATGILKIVESFENIQKNVVSSANMFNWKDIVEKYGKIYKEILQKGDRVK